MIAFSQMQLFTFGNKCFFGKHNKDYTLELLSPLVLQITTVPSEMKFLDQGAVQRPAKGEMKMEMHTLSPAPMLCQENGELYSWAAGITGFLFVSMPKLRCMFWPMKPFVVRDLGTEAASSPRKVLLWYDGTILRNATKFFLRALLPTSGDGMCTKVKRSAKIIFMQSHICLEQDCTAAIWKQGDRKHKNIESWGKLLQFWKQWRNSPS